MKKLIDYNQQELEHIVKYNEFYKVLSYILFAGFILASLWAVMTDRMYEKQCRINEIQDSVYIDVLEQQKLNLDTIVWLNECGVKFENE